MTDAAGHHDDPNLAHHFDSPGQQYASAKTGMWVFLATEILMFGGLFCAYAVYRRNHPEIFEIGHRFLDANLGALNTVILLLSSFTMAWAVRAAQLNQQRATVVLLSLTLIGGAGFMGVKYLEYSHKIHLGLAPGKFYLPNVEHGGAASSADTRPAEPTEDAGQTETPADRSHIAPAPDGPAGLAESARRDEAAASRAADQPHFASPEELDKARMFFSIYYLLTGLHGIHVLVGMGVIVWLIRRAARGEFSSRYFTPVDLGGLYWHLVDLIWIFLFPLLYLIH